MERVIFVPGIRVSLVIPEKKDLEIMYKAINNINITRHLSEIKHYTKEAEEKFLDSILSGNKKFFIIMENKTQEILGGISFNEFNEISRSGVIGITLYDETKMSKGYGSEGLKLFLKYSFEYLGLNKVKLEVYVFNKRAIKAYEKCGFKTVGILVQEKYIMGKYEDSMIMEMLRSEYEKIYLST